MGLLQDGPWDEPGANLEVICRNLTYIITAMRIISGDVLK